LSFNTLMNFRPQLLKPLVIQAAFFGFATPLRDRGGAQPYPRGVVFSRTGGRQCGDGWNDLVQPLEDELSRLSGTIRQIREKFGPCAFTTLCHPKSRESSGRHLLDASDKPSVHICETCGRPGELVCDDGLYLTACGACREAIRLRKNGHS
jgi:hypothetical protein